MQIEIAITPPKNPLIRLAEATVRPDKEAVSLSLPSIRSPLRKRLMETVENLADGRVAPAVRRSVGSVCTEFRVVPAEALDLHGEPAVAPEV